MSGVVNVYCRWGDYVVGVHDVRAGQVLGRLVRFRGRQPRVVVAAESERVLAPGETLRFSRDGLDYVVSWWVGPEVAAWRSGKSGRWIAVSAVALVLVLATGWLAPARWPRLARVDTPLVEQSPMRVRVVASEEAPIEHETSFAVARVPQAHEEEITGNSRCGDALMGSRVEPSASRHYGLWGPPDTADVHMTRDRERGPSAGDARLVPMGPPQRAPGTAGPTVRWGRDTSLGRDEKSAHGNMWGDDLGESEGEDGMGRAGTPGGLAKRLEAAPLPAGDGPRVVHAGLRVSGARKPSEVGRTLAPHFDELRSCAREMDAAHRVELHFTVAPAGNVHVAPSARDALESCLQRVLGEVVFSEPAAASTDVIYPLHFLPAADSLRTRDVPTPAPERCECG